MKWAGHVACMRDRIGSYRVLLGRNKRKRPLGKPKLRWEGNIKMGLQEGEREGMGWIGLAQDRDK